MTTFNTFSDRGSKIYNIEKYEQNHVFSQLLPTYLKITLYYMYHFSNMIIKRSDSKWADYCIAQFVSKLIQGFFRYFKSMDTNSSSFDLVFHNCQRVDFPFPPRKLGKMIKEERGWHIPKYNSVIFQSHRANPFPIYHFFYTGKFVISVFCVMCYF